jgi:hypothetical protein
VIECWSSAARYRRARCVAWMAPAARPRVCVWSVFSVACGHVFVMMMLIVMYDTIGVENPRPALGRVDNCALRRLLFKAQVKRDCERDTG